MSLILVDHGKGLFDSQRLIVKIIEIETKPK